MTNSFSLECLSVLFFSTTSLQPFSPQPSPPSFVAFSFPPRYSTMTSSSSPSPTTGYRPAESVSTRLRVQPEDTFLRDATHRAWLLRGVNLSGSSKFPRYPVPVPSHVRGDTFLKARGGGSGPSHTDQPPKEVNEDGKVNANEPSHEREHQQQQQQHGSRDRISFKGRPFELDEADEHLSRLRHWGFRMIRWVVTWEAIEHQGP